MAKKNIVQDTLLDISLFLIGSRLTYVAVFHAVPILSERLGIMPLGAWMLVAIPIVLLPLILGGLLILRTEGKIEDICKRLRIRKLTKADWRWTFIGLGGILIGSGIAFFIANSLNINTNPPFARNVEAWTNGHFWMFGLWLIYWPINILGEEFAW